MDAWMHGCTDVWRADRMTGCHLRVDKFINKVRGGIDRRRPQKTLDEKPGSGKMGKWDNAEKRRRRETNTGSGHGLGLFVSGRRSSNVSLPFEMTALLHHTIHRCRHRRHPPSRPESHSESEFWDIYSRDAANWQPLDSSCQSNESTALSRHFYN